VNADQRVTGLAKESLQRVREQARLQVAGRGQPKPLYELLLDVEPSFGLDRLPLPKPGDLFLDLEGDPFVQGTGLEYLFGLVELGAWSMISSRAPPLGRRTTTPFVQNPRREKRAFEAVIDRIFAGRAEFADLHVFHFGTVKRTRSRICHAATRHVKPKSTIAARARASGSARHREAQLARLGRELHPEAARRLV